MKKTQAQQELIELAKSVARLEQTLRDRTVIQDMLQRYRDKKLVDG